MGSNGWRSFILDYGFKLAIGTFSLGAALSIIGIISSLNVLFTSHFSNLFLSVGFGVFTLTFGIISLRVYLESDELLSSIATSDFYEITYRFWDRAEDLYTEEEKLERDTISWQLGNLFRHAEKLKKWAEPDVQEKLIREFKIFLERLSTTSCERYWVEIKNYLSVCKIAMNFKTDNENYKNKLIDELTSWIGKKREEESNVEYLHRKNEEFTKKEKYDVFSLELED